MRLRGFVIGLVVGALSAGRAWACVHVHGYPEDVQLAPHAAARAMAKAATYVDLVTVEQLTPDFELGTRSVPWGPMAPGPPGLAGIEPYPGRERYMADMRSSWGDAYRIHYRVVESLKMKSAPQFQISGTRPIPIPAQFPHPHRQEVSIKNLKYYLDQEDLAAWPGPGACVQEVRARIGQTYLVFRGADGYLVRTPVPIHFHGRVSQISGPAVFPVDGPSATWVRIVRHEIKHPAVD